MFRPAWQAWRTRVCPCPVLQQAVRQSSWRTSLLLIRRTWKVRMEGLRSIGGVLWPRCSYARTRACLCRMLEMAGWTLCLRLAATCRMLRLAALACGPAAR